MSELAHIITLSVGDWSGDGHGKSDSIVIRSNLDKKAIEKSYRKATKELGFDFCKDVCAEWEDNNLPKEMLDALVERGLKTVKMDIDFDIERSKKDNEWEVHLWVNDYANIYLFIVALGNKEFQYIPLDGDINPTIHIGGYGIYD